MHICLRYILFGLLIGFLFALFGVLMKQNRLFKDGIFVSTTHLKKDHLIEAYVKNICPYFKIGRIGVDPRYTHFVKEIDELIGQKLRDEASGKFNKDYIAGLFRQLSHGIQKAATPQYHHTIQALSTSLNELL